MSSFCEREIFEAAKDFLSRGEVKALADTLTKNAQDKIDSEANTFNDAISNSADDLKDEIERQQIIAKRNKLLSFKVRKEIQRRVETGVPEKDAADNLLKYLDGQFDRGKLSRASTGLAQKTTVQMLSGEVVTGLEKEGLFHLIHEQQFGSDLASELFEEGSSKNLEARKASEIIRKVYEKGVRIANNYGADIRLLKNFVANQSHNAELLMQTAESISERMALWARLVRKHGFDKAKDIRKGIAFNRWKNFVLPRIDVARTFAGITKQDEYLKTVWTGLTNGFRDDSIKDLDLGDSMRFAKPESRAAKISKHRQIIFKDGKSWSEYNTTYGGRTFGGAITSTIDKLGRNIGLLKYWGPNPNAMFDDVESFMRKKYSMVPKLKSKLIKARWIFDMQEGKANIPVSNLLGKIGTSIRSFNIMARLGNIFLSSISDLAVRGFQMRYYGEGLLDRYANGISAFGSSLTRAERKQFGSIVGTYARSQLSHTFNRLNAVDAPMGTMSKSLDLFFKLAGMNEWDGMMRTGMGETFSKMMTVNRGLTFDNLPSAIKEDFGLYGIEDKEWDVYRNNAQAPFGNEKFITPDGLNAAPDTDIEKYLGKEAGTASEKELFQARTSLEEKLRMYFIDKTDSVSLYQPEATDRAIMLRGTKPGTVEGEALRFIAQFKLFSTAYLRRVLLPAVRRGDIAGLSELMVSSTIIGYLIVQAKNLERGIVPTGASTLSDFGKGAIQGGAMSIYADYLFGHFDSYGTSALVKALGPTAGTVDDVARVLSRMRDMENPSKGILHIAENNTPFMNLWFTRTALDYMFLYGIQERMSPGYLRRMQSRLKADKNKRFLFAPTQYANKL